MKKNNICISFLILFLSQNAFSQIDTTDWYPLHIGDKWEYYGKGFGYSQVEIIGDTLMPNGKTYYIFSDGVDAWRFQRKECDSLVYYYSTSEHEEFLLFDFIATDKTLWEETTGYYLGILATNSDNRNILTLQLPYKIFERAIIDASVNPPDTVWGYLIDAYPTRITKGFGVDSYMYNLETLVGAVINGVGYGTLVGVENDLNKNTPNNFNIYQNYPNPFNASTLIRYEVADSRDESQNINLSVYNTLGQRVTILVNKFQKSGSYEVMFNAEMLPSGTYFIQLRTEKYQKTIKAILLK
jgi:hypothetical protein